MTTTVGVIGSGETREVFRNDTIGPPPSPSVPPPPSVSPLVWRVAINLVVQNGQVNVGAATGNPIGGVPLGGNSIFAADVQPGSGIAITCDRAAICAYTLTAEPAKGSS